MRDIFYINDPGHCCDNIVKVEVGNPIPYWHCYVEEEHLDMMPAGWVKWDELGAEYKNNGEPWNVFTTPEQLKNTNGGFY